MARTVEVELQLDSSGAVQKVESASASFERLGDSADRARNDLDGYAQAARDQGQASEEAAQGAREQAAAQDRVASTGTRMNSTVSSSANNLGFELVQASQDAKFGLAGVANQIPLMSEQFSQLQAKTGSTTGAMSALFSALKGPAGIIGAFTLLLTFKDEIIGFFTDAGDSAEEASKKVEALQSAASSLIQVELGLEADDIESIDRAEQLLENIRGEISEIEATQGLQAAFAERSPNQAVIEQLERAQELLRQGRASVDELGDIGDILQLLRESGVTLQELQQEGVSVIEDRIEAREGELEPLRELESETESSITKAEALRSAYEQLPDDLQNAGEEGEKALDDLNEAANATIEQLTGDVEGPEELIPQEMPDLGAELDINFQTAIQSAEDAASIIGSGMLDSVNDVNEAMAALDREFRNATSQEQRNRIRALIQELQGLRSEMRGASEQSLKLGDTLERGLAKSITAAAQAVGEGENVAKAILTTLAGLAQRVGKMLIGFGTSMLALRSIISNPAGAIAAGTALVALGAAAKNAISEQFEGATSGSSVNQRSRQLEGGGEATTEINAPGRASGGPVQAGRPYTVGERGPETFVPGSDGFVLPNGAVEAATSTPSRSGQMSVDVTANGEITAGNFDVATLRARLNELEAEITQLR